MLKLRLTECLAEAEISKNEFARRLGKPSPAVRAYFKEGYDPKLSSISAWVDAIGCDVSELLRVVPGEWSKKRETKTKKPNGKKKGRQNARRK